MAERFWCIPIGSVYGIFTYIWLKFVVNVGKCRFIYHTWILWDICDHTVDERNPANHLGCIKPCK